MLFVDVIHYFLEVLHFIFDGIAVCLVISDEYFRMFLIFLIQDPEIAGADIEAEHWEIWFLLNQTFSQRVFVLLLVLFEVAHIEILLVAALYLADVFSAFLLVFEVNLHVLLEIGSRCESFAAFIADKRFLLCMDSSVPVQIRLLIELLVTSFEVALIGLEACVGHFVSLQTGLYSEFFAAIGKFASVPLLKGSFMCAGGYFDVVI